MKSRQIFDYILTAVLLIGLAVYGSYHKDELAGIYQRLINKVYPCHEPLKYSLGTFDKRFGISEADFLKSVADASAIWSKALGRPLFVYADNGPLKINLVYDYRQEATAKLKTLGIEIKDDRSSYDKLRTQYESMLNDYNAKKAAYNQAIQDYNALKQSYESQVNYWNAHGGAPRGMFSSLEQTRNELNAKAAALNQMQSDLNALVENVNASVAVLNRLIKSLNLRVDNYNAVGGTIGEEFQEGEYKVDASGEEINIYQFDNRTQLVRVLAHELGHALGLEHVDDPKAIMYRLNEGLNDKLTASDISALNATCKAK